MIMKYYEKQSTFSNPILSGFYPDPSICRVEDDYYLVTSSFTYFPGIPIFHSKDLVNWRQIGHVLNRKSQLNLGAVGHSNGIFAPTIRYHEGIYYVITTCVGGGGNFIVTTDNPAGDWWDPYWIENAPGIDPSLFFDDDGRVYYTGNRSASSGEKYYGDCEIWLQEIDVKKMKLIGKDYVLWKGALVDAVWPEAPHVYKKDGLYYLMISEGGTGHEHAVTIARSQKITGPYVGDPANPILTHRHLGRNYPIVNVGHGDLIETQQGEWWIVVLASRPYGGYYRNLGRETFLVPVIWENGWPIMSPGTGKVEFSYKRPNLTECRWPKDTVCDHFNTVNLDFKWNSLRSSIEDSYDLTARPGWLRLKLKPERLTELTSPSFLGRRQQHISFTAAAVMEFTPEHEHESAGLVLVQSNQYHYRFTRTISNGEQIIQLIKCAAGKEKVLAEKECNSHKIYLKIQAWGQDYSFYYGDNPTALHALKENADGRILSTDLAGGFVGTYIGLYASSNGVDSTNYADFDWFEYQGLS